ncbi:MAG: hypothetical protein GX561_10020, partial [Lentisphaerae bacterium]|nr:hypothetical protein [Lentisphaerota bacterium]
RRARTQAMSPLKRLNMAKPQPVQPPRSVLLQSGMVLSTGTRGARTQTMSPLKRLNMAHF